MEFDALRTHVHKAIGAHAAISEELIRMLLENWVSELEPSVCYDKHGNVIGLCDARAEVGSQPFILRIQDCQ